MPSSPSQDETCHSEWAACPLATVFSGRRVYPAEVPPGEPRVVQHDKAHSKDDGAPARLAKKVGTVTIPPLAGHLE